MKMWNFTIRDQGSKQDSYLFTTNLKSLQNNNVDLIHEKA